jgi:DNA-binding phage protein
MAVRIQEYVREDGSSPFGQWFERLDARGVQGEEEGQIEACHESRRRQGSEKRGVIMALTREFKRSVAERIARDPEFARALLHESAALFLNGEPDVARLTLRGLVNSTLGFERLAGATGTPAKSLHRMLSTTGNPSMDNLAVIFAAVGRALGVGLRVTTTTATRRRRTGFGETDCPLPAIPVPVLRP